MAKRVAAVSGDLHPHKSIFCFQKHKQNIFTGIRTVLGLVPYINEKKNPNSDDRAKTNSYLIISKPETQS